MYKNLLVPVDLEHPDQSDKAISVGVDLAKHYDADITLVSVAMSGPSAVARNPEQFGEKLSNFASAKSAEFDKPIASKVMISHDPTIDIDETLRNAATEIDADLVVMASHIPGFKEYVLASRAGYLASHAETSVMIVR
ncbi:MAG: universal stress protein [Pseudomonadota bacterium]